MPDVNLALKASYQDGFFGRAIPTGLYGGYIAQLWKPDGSIFLTPSHNWQGVAILADALNNVNGHPHVVSLAECFRWITAFLEWQKVKGWMEHEQDSDIYARHHHGFVRGLRALGMKKGEAKLAALCDEWLLVALVHAAVSRSRGPVRLLSDKARQPAPGPATYVTTVPSSIFGHALPGQREESTKGDGVISVDVAAEDGFFLEAVRGVYAKGSYGTVLKLTGYAYDFGLDAGTKGDLLLASARDVAALRRLLERIATVPCALETWIEWTTEGINGWAPYLPGGSTLGKGVHIIREPSGEQVILLAGNGGRDTGAEDLDIGPSEATIDWPSRTVKIRRTDTGQMAGPVALAGGERVALMVWDKAGHRLVEPAAAPAPVPAPEPPIVDTSGQGRGQQDNGGCLARLLGGR